jgi:hypothetical protein
MDLFSELNVVFEGCPPATARFVFEQVVKVLPSRRDRPTSWSDFTIQEILDARNLIAARRLAGRILAGVAS